MYSNSHMPKRFMKPLFFITLSGLFLSSGVLHAKEDLRTWTSIDGETVEACYVSLVMDSVNVEDEQGRTIKLPLGQLSEKDIEYVELRNPPELKVEYNESAPTREYTADAWTTSDGGYTAMNNPIHIIEGSFGAKVRKTSSAPYRHELTIEMMVFTVQNLDRDKYHLIAHTKSTPFKLEKDGGNAFTYQDDKVHNILYYDLSGKWPRGEKLGEYLILVFDRRGEIIAHRSSGNWLYDNHEKLMSLPIGAWVKEDAERVYPTTPIRSSMD